MPDLPEPWLRWRHNRPSSGILHLDSAAAGRSSLATIERTVTHLRSEADIGTYPAEARAADDLEALRSAVGELLGMPAAAVAFVGSASAGLDTLLASWPLPEHATVAVAPGEWGSNLASFETLGVRPVVLGADAEGSIELASLEHRVRTDPPTLIHVTQVAAHSGLVQPVAAIADIARRAGIPLWVDAAQAIGHVDAAGGADAVYATGRKWLCGPRGVGVLAIAERWWPTLRVRPDVLAASGRPPMRAFEAADAHVAGRLALGTAVREFVEIGPTMVQQRLAEVGASARAVLGSAPGWAVVTGSASAIVALRPLLGQDVVEVRARLLSEHAILTTASSVARAPLEMTVPTLRVSPHVDCTAAELERLLVALDAVRQS